jgi:hypothetical protein
MFGPEGVYAIFCAILFRSVHASRLLGFGGAALLVCAGLSSSGFASRHSSLLASACGFNFV